MVSGPRMELPSVSPTPTSSPRPHSQISDTEDEDNWPQWNSDTSQDLFTSQSDFTRESSELQSSSRGNSFLEDTDRPSASCGPSTSTATSGATAPPRKKARMSSSSNNWTNDCNVIIYLEIILEPFSTIHVQNRKKNINRNKSWIRITSSFLTVFPTDFASRPWLNSNMVPIIC